MSSGDDKRAYFRAKLDRLKAERRGISVPTAKCTQCGAGLQDGVKFCGACGAKVEQPQPCTNCGTILPVGTKFCGECGTAAGAAAKSTPSDKQQKQEKTRIPDAQLCSVSFAKIRDDWDEDRFRNEVSFWSRDDGDSLFVDKQGNSLDQRRGCFQMINYEDGMAFSLRDYSGKIIASGAGYADREDAVDEVKKALKTMLSLSEDQLGDLTFLMLNSDDSESLDCDLSCRWISALGEGSVLFVDEDVAGRVFVEVDPPAQIEVTIDEDGSFDYDGDEVCDARDESLQFVGIMLE